MKKPPVSFFVLLLYCVVQAQQISLDSSEASYELVHHEIMEEDSLAGHHVDIYYSRALASNQPGWIARASFLKGKFLASTPDPNQMEVLKLYEKSLELSKKIDNYQLNADVLTALGYLYKNRIRNRDSATFYFNKSLDQSLETNYHNGIMQARTALSYLDMDAGNYPLAIEKLLKNRSIIDLLDSDEEKGRLLNNLGHVYLKLGLNEDAILFFRESAKVLENTDKNSLKVLVRLNKAEATLSTGNVRRTFELLEEAATLSEKGFPVYKGFYHETLGRAYLANGEWSKALEAFNISQKISYNLTVAIGRSNVYRERGMLKVAHQILLEALNEDNIIKSTVAKNGDLYFELSRSYEAIQEPDSALMFMKKYIENYKKVHNEKILSQFLLKEMKERLQLQQNESMLEADILNERLQASRNQRYLVLIICLMLLSIMVVIIIRYRQNRKHTNILAEKNNALEEQKREIETQAKLLEAANKKVNEVNDNLNRLVEKRTQEVLEKDIILDEYAFINSHKLRAPVAAIKGISAYFHSADDSEKDQLLRDITVQIQRLDEIVHQIQDVLAEKSTLSKELIEELAK